MQIQRVLAPSLREALQRARRLHGEDAIVISQELSANGVTLAVARRTPPAARVLETARDPKAAQRDRAFAEVAARLRRHGASDALVEEVQAGIAAERSEDRHVLDVAADVLGAAFDTVKLPRARGRARVLALVGNSGVGKTTTIAKLAMRLVRANRRVELMTFDAERPGAVEQLRAWAELLGTPFEVAHTGDELRSASITTADLVLVDTCGRRDRDVELLERMRAACLAIGTEMETYVVLSAGAARNATRTAIEAWSALNPTAAVVTRLDETSEITPTLEIARASGLPIAFFSDGPDVHTNLQRAASESFGDLCLRGRLA
jgi:flagellar biosynthesis protein FlhF